MKTVLGLDVGTNSIGGALVRIGNLNEYGREGSIEWLGSRIIPVDGDMLRKYESGGLVETKAAARTKARSARRLKHRYKLRRTRLIKAFKILGWISPDFPEDFKKSMNQDPSFKFHIDEYLPFDETTIDEALEEFGLDRGEGGTLPFSPDWIIYYLRKKALSKKITLKELARIIYIMNQRRGFKSSRKDLRETTVLAYEEFNQIRESIVRGQLSDYNTGRGQQLETKFVAITRIQSVKQEGDEKDGRGNYSFTVTAADPRLAPWVEKRKKKPEWEGKEQRLVVTQRIDRKGKFEQLKPQAPKEDEWELAVVALDNQLDATKQYPGEFFFNRLVEDRNYKIRQTAVKREKYQAELNAIWTTQSKFHPELTDKSKLRQLAEALYPTQAREKKEKLKYILSHDLYHLIANDIIYYQRELRSQKKLIGGCRFEYHKYKKNDEVGKARVKVAPVSSPEFQEFRIWQDIHNLRIVQNEKVLEGRTRIDIDVTDEYVNDKTKEMLFELFDSLTEVDQTDIFTTLNLAVGKEELTNDTHRINLFANRKALKGNETKDLFRKAFRKYNFEARGNGLLADEQKFYRLWHVLYSISSSIKDKSEKGIRSALTNPNHGFDMPSDLITHLATRFPEFPNRYGSFSSKAIKKLLSVMRCGSKWSWESIPQDVRERIERLITEGWDFAIDKRTGELIEKRHFNQKRQFQGMPAWMACYVVYGRHSERESEQKYTSYQQIDVMKLVPHNSLRNPIVEQVIRETLRVVKDVWKQYGQPEEIHVELARDLKKNAEERRKIAERNSANFLERQRIKQILYELKNGPFEEYDDEGKTRSNFDVEPNPESARDIEKFRVWKSLGEGAVEREQWVELQKFFHGSKIEKSPSSKEIRKYTLWLSQKCVSPYTGKIIPLSKLFTSEYEVEHIIPQSKLKDDSLENLVICEAAVNKEKGELLARLFIRRFSGQTLTLGGTKYPIMLEGDYLEHCKRTFRGRKRTNLLREDIPEDFVSRQINDTRFISRKLNELLYPIVKDKEGLVFTVGSITSELRGQWGLNHVWKELLRPRFERLEKIVGQKLIFPVEEYPNKFHFNVPGNPHFNAKRIDHRHHALDALVIATTTREHIRYLNSLNAVDSRDELKAIKLRLVKRKIREFALPWPTFVKDAKESLGRVICSVKTNNKLVTQPQNRYLKWNQKENGEWVKEFVNQVPPEGSGKSWLAVRRSMFKEPLGIIHLKRVKEVKPLRAIEIEIERANTEGNINSKTASYIYDKVIRVQIKAIVRKYDRDIEAIKRALKKEPLTNPKGEAVESVKVAEFVPFAAKRVAIDKSFTHDKINKIPYSDKSHLAQLLRAHLKEHGDKPEEAFQGEGLEALEKKNGGRPIKKVTIYEDVGNKEKLNGKLVEVDKGSVMYFVVYENLSTCERKERYSVPLLDSIYALANKKPIAPPKDGFKAFILSPNDLVYVPTDDEWLKRQSGDRDAIDWTDMNTIAERVYRVVSSSNKDCYFIQHHISKAIMPYDRKQKIKGEIDWNDKSTKAMDGVTAIVDRCIKLSVDRLGKIEPVR